tara:strand:- start:240 stop:596 length:357 start_codon:yes stop_codon:yes gene_type:complete
MNRRVSNALPSKFESLSVKNLNVEHLNVSKGHNLSGVSDIKVPEENLDFESLFNMVREFQMRLEKLESENLVLKDKLNNLNLEDLKNVDITVYEREDGAFLGWADDIKNWVPFREGGT